MLGELIRTADFKNEKHVPAIEIKGEVKKGQPVEVEVCVGKEISHPNTPEHHIAWIELYFLPEGSKSPFMVGRVAFPAHGELGAITEPRAIFTVKFDKPGTLIALSYCNLHGVWESTKKVDIAE